MKKDYQKNAACATMPALPQAVTVALAELAGDVQEGLLAMAVGTGLQVMAAMMSVDVEAGCGPRGKHDPTRTAVHHGSEAGSVTLGGRRVPVASDELFSQTEVLGRMAMGRMLAGLSTRRYPVGLGQCHSVVATGAGRVGRRGCAGC